MNRNLFLFSIFSIVLFTQCQEKAIDFKTEEIFRIMSVEDIEYVRTKFQMRYEDTASYKKYFKNISHFSNKDALYYSQWLPSYNSFYQFNFPMHKKNLVHEEKVLLFTYNLSSEKELPIIQDTLLILLTKTDFGLDTFWIPVGFYNYNQYGRFVSTDMHCNWRIEMRKDTSLLSTIQLGVNPTLSYRKDDFGYVNFEYFFTPNQNRKLPVNLSLKLHSKDGQFELCQNCEPRKIIASWYNDFPSRSMANIFMINEWTDKEPFYNEKLKSSYTLGLVTDEKFNVFSSINHGTHIFID